MGSESRLLLNLESKLCDFGQVPNFFRSQFLIANCDHGTYHIGLLRGLSGV